MSDSINRSQARSMVVSTHGLVASEHPLASQAGATILAQGGHAVDAAIAANAVMGVVSPMMCGVGGDLFAIVWEASGAMHGVNASGWAPAGLSPRFLEKQLAGTTGSADLPPPRKASADHHSLGEGGQVGQSSAAGMPQSGVHSVTVPGAVAGWSLLLERFGRLSLSRILAAAISCAEDGVPISEIVAAGWAASEAFLKTDPEATRVFLRGGRALQLGEKFSNPDVAWVYRQLVNSGTEAFYRGEIARRMVNGMQRRGGTMTSADLDEYRAEWVEPISTTYRGWEVYEIPPNGAGIAALMMLNILEEFPLGRYGHNSVEALHALIEAKKLAYADMQRYVADPRNARVPVGAMLDKDYARGRAASIDLMQAQSSVSHGQLPVHAGDTTYLCAVDREGNIVSLIQSNYASFGSGVVAEGTGFALQNRGGLFTLDPSHPNVLAPRKRPLHTIIPACMRRDELRVAFGIMGAWNQSLAHAQFVSNVVDHRMNIQAALEAPRFTKLTFEGRDVMLEGRIPEPVRSGLARKGHEIEVQGDFCSLMGGGQAIMRNTSTGVNYGASDPRKDGAAVPEPITKN